MRRDSLGAEGGIMVGSHHRAPRACTGEDDVDGIAPIKKILPGLAWYRPFETFGYAFIRLSTGAIVLAHGINRLFFAGPGAELGPYLGQLPIGAIGAFELAGGAMLALGLLTRLVALLLVLEWLAIAVAVPVRPGTSWLMLGATPHYPAMVAAMCLASVLRGGGRYSLDRLIGKEF
jgi:putative oxidoreductase